VLRVLPCRPLCVRGLQDKQCASSTDPIVVVPRGLSVLWRLLIRSFDDTMLPRCASSWFLPVARAGAGKFATAGKAPDLLLTAALELLARKFVCEFLIVLPRLKAVMSSIPLRL
jgi:hypothetical protein